jgi:hypothetical protein
MKFSTTLVILLVSVWQQATAQDTLYWNAAEKLQWQDFEGMADSNSRFAAATSTGIVWGYAFKGGSFTFSAQSYFVKRKSWKRGEVTDRMLEHEQGHFDITEIFTRRLKAKATILSSNRRHFEQTIQKLVSDILKEKDKLQRQYDVETNFGTNYMAQTKWLEKIANMIK